MMDEEDNTRRRSVSLTVDNTFNTSGPQDENKYQKSLSRDQNPLKT